MYPAGVENLFKVPKDPVKTVNWNTICGKQFIAPVASAQIIFFSSSIIHSRKRALLLPYADPILTQRENKLDLVKEASSIDYNDVEDVSPIMSSTIQLEPFSTFRIDASNTEVSFIAENGQNPFTRWL